MAGRERWEFPGSQGGRLAARIDRPAGPVRAWALLAHCFTCGKDIAAASRIARELAALGLGVVRFDFTGLGHSEGEFASTSFSSNVEDLVRAADAMRAELEAPALLIGHSLGGAAVLEAAHRIDEVRAVVTIGAPSDPAHVEGLLVGDRDALERDGEASVEIAGRPFRIRRDFLDDLRARDPLERLGRLRRALLVMHAPRDGVVGIEHASRIFEAARHPKSFVSLDDADHLLSDRADAAWAARTLAAWAARYLPAPDEEPAARAEPDEVVVREAGDGRYAQTIAAGPHLLRADEPESVGGDDSGATPYGLLLASLGACTSMTLRMYAERKQIPLERVTVRLRHHKIHARDCADCETREGRVDEIAREISLEGELDAPTRARLLEIADRCPVHRTLHGEVRISTRET